MTLRDNTELTEALNKILANTYALYLKTQNYHWNITGPNFFSLHKLLEAQYEELAKGVDVIAEQIRIYDEKTHASFDYFKKHSVLQDPDHLLNWQAMVTDLMGDHKKIKVIILELVLLCQKNGEFGTEDILRERVLFHEKAAWMLESHIV